MTNGNRTLKRKTSSLSSLCIIVLLVLYVKSVFAPVAFFVGRRRRRRSPSFLVHSCLRCDSGLVYHDLARARDNRSARWEKDVRRTRSLSKSKWLTTSISDGSTVTHSLTRYWLLGVRLPKLGRRSEEKKDERLCHMNINVAWSIQGDYSMHTDERERERRGVGRAIGLVVCEWWRTNKVRT